MGLVYNKDHTIAEINEITDATSNMKVSNQLKDFRQRPKNKNNKKLYIVGQLLEVW